MTKRLIAWIAVGSYPLFLPDGTAATDGWRRAPWLDEPGTNVAPNADESLKHAVDSEGGIESLFKLTTVQLKQAIEVVEDRASEYGDLGPALSILHALLEVGNRRGWWRDKPFVSDFEHSTYQRDHHLNQFGDLTKLSEATLLEKYKRLDEPTQTGYWQQVARAEREAIYAEVKRRESARLEGSILDSRGRKP